MALSKDIVGKKLDRYNFTIEKGKIKEFCIAIGEKDPIYFDRNEAIKAGYKDTPAPPTYPTVVQFWGYPKIWEDMVSMGIDVGRILHLKEEYTYIQPLYPGEVSANAEVVDVKTGKMDMVTFKTTILNSNNEPCVEAQMSIVIRPEGQ